MDDCTVYKVHVAFRTSVAIQDGFDICDGVERSSLQLKLVCCHFETFPVGGELKENYAHGSSLELAPALPPPPHPLAKSA
jgi:hypothetical protein